ncbi:death ligand signal enhancer isoform X1 [Lepisosteus oculatus]|uniref:death ligand signal enhancer isoform X1 n=1 Tax=Lepisosteus oculatus TaxID=7918 RepID=UPI0035F504ED
MWRIHGLVGRVLNRCHVSTPLRLSQGHHVEDDVLNSSSLLSSGLHPFDSSSQRGENGDRQRNERTFHYYSARLPRYTALDAVGWGAATVLFLQVFRRIHSQFSSPSDKGQYREPLQVHRCSYRALLEILSCHNALPRSINARCLRSLETGSSEDSTADLSSSASLNQDTSVTEDGLSAVIADSEDAEAFEKLTENNSLPPEEGLTGAANNFKSVTESNVPIILNIIGLENAKRGDYCTAFSCFLAAAKHNYSKAHFNVAVCYEKGRGVAKDMEKAAVYYRQAAAAGHSQAQFRYAKYLLHSKEQQDPQDSSRAIAMLEKAAASGVREAQAYLGVLFSQEPQRNGKKAVHYLQMAAKNGDAQSQFNLGQCYEMGFGVQRCYMTALDHYQQAAAAGSEQACCMLRALWGQGERGRGLSEDVMLRSVSSSPCFSGAETFSQRRDRASKTKDPCGPNRISRTLPHSWSTDSIHTLPMINVTSSVLAELSEMDEALKSCRLSKPRHCSWTIGVG